MGRYKTRIRFFIELSMDKVQVNNKKGLLRREFLTIIFSVIFYFSFITIFDQDQMSLILPVFCLVSMMFYLTFKLMRIDGRIPIFDVGFFMIGITFLYMFYPYFTFMLSGFEFSLVSDQRMKSYNVDAKDLGSFAWFHVAYLSSLIIGYLFFRPKTPMTDFTHSLKVNKSEVKIALLLLIGIIILEILLPIIFGDFHARPHFINQILGLLASVKFVFTLYFMIFCFAHWKMGIAKSALFAYIGFEFFNILTGEAGRTWIFLHLCAAAMLYDRLVSPMSIKKIIAISFIALIAFIALGFFRHGAGDGLTSLAFFVSGSNEFTSLLGTAYDIYMRKEVLGTLNEIRWQVYFDDIIYLIPSQLLPFEKLDLSSWYLKVIDQYGKGVGFMFGVTSQGIIGGGVVELFFRGLLTGAFFAWLHKIYLRNCDSFWMLVFYVFIAIKSYYIFRASTGYLPYFIIYHYLPVYILVKFILKATLSAKRKDYLVHTQN